MKGFRESVQTTAAQLLSSYSVLVGSVGGGGGIEDRRKSGNRRKSLVYT